MQTHTHHKLALCKQSFLQPKTQLDYFKTLTTGTIMWNYFFTNPTPPKKKRGPSQPLIKSEKLLFDERVYGLSFC